jgi:hypothetical protein
VGVAPAPPPTPPRATEGGGGGGGSGWRQSGGRTAAVSEAEEEDGGELDYDITTVPSCKGPLNASQSVVVAVQTRATWLAAVDEMAAVCHEAQRRRALRLVRASCSPRLASLRASCSVLPPARTLKVGALECDLGENRSHGRRLSKRTR